MNEVNLLLVVIATFGVVAAAVASTLAVRFYRVSLAWKHKSSTFHSLPIPLGGSDMATGLTQQSLSALTLRSHASLLRKRGVGSLTYWPATETFVVDAGTLNLLGLPAVDEGGSLSLDVVLGAVEEVNRDDLRQALLACSSADGGPYPKEVHLAPLRREGAVKQLALVLEPVGANGDEAAHVVGFGWDITSSARAERDLAISNERLQLALEATRIGLVSIAPETSEVWLDATALRLFHSQSSVTSGAAAAVVDDKFASEDQVALGAWLSRINHVDRSELLQRLTAKEPAPNAFRRRLTLNDGVTHLQLFAHRRTDVVKGNSWIGVVWSVTAEVQREQALTVARQQAHAANAAKSKFLASMSHEIRTPLNAILGFSELLSRDVTLSETQREQLRTVHQSGRNLLGILNDVLDMAKVETGSAALAEETVDLAGVTHEIRKLYWPQAAAKGLRLDLTVAPDLPSVLVFDVNRFRQVMNHLLLNSLRYTTTGHISIAVSAELTFEHRYRVTVRVSNTGPGIAVAEQERIFQPFERGEDAAESGTGLGLSISRDLARLLKGDLTVESDGVSGASFTLTFVATIAKQQDRFSNAPRVTWLTADSPTATVLVVDDRESNRSVISAMLEKVGVSVAIAKSGRHALELLTTCAPNVALLDLRMPDMSGYEIAKRAKADPLTAHIPLIAVSASVHDFYAHPDAELFDDFAAKPINMDELMGLIAKHTPVRFAYNVDTPHVTNVPRDVALTLTALALPNRPQLCDALESLDYNRFVSLLDLTPELPVAVREHLRGLAARFDNEALLTLLRLP